MSNEIALKNEQLISAIDRKGIADVIKPLVSEIHLFDTYIAGTSYLADETPLKNLKIDDRLTLRREETIYDDKAIMVLTGSDEKLGYIPEKDNIIFSRLMDAGKLLIAKVKDIKDLHHFMKISISIYLVDY